MATALPDFDRFDSSDTTNCAPRWKKYLARFNILMEALEIPETDAGKKRKKALLLHYVGGETFDIYETLKGADDKFNDVVEKLSNYFVPKANAEYEKYVFRNSKQTEGESLDQFCTRLRKLSINCEFADGDTEIKSQIIQGCISHTLRKKALSKTMTLNELIETGKVQEQTKLHTSIIEGTNVENPISHVNHKHDKTRSLRHQTRLSSSHTKNSEKQTHTSSQKHRSNLNENKKCYKCGGTFPHETSCPAANRRCYACNRIGHYSSLCRSQSKKYKSPNFNASSANCLDHRESTQYEHSLCEINADESDCSLSIKKKNGNVPTVNISVNGVLCEMIIDSGASVNTIDEVTYLEIRKQCPVQLRETDTKLFAYGGSEPLPLLGKFTAHLKKCPSCRESQTADIYVAKEAKGCLLSYNAANKLGVIRIVNSVSKDKSAQLKIVRDYEDLFDSDKLGKLKDFQLKLNIDESVTPIHQKHRRIPFAMRAKVEQAVQQLCDNDICESVENTPTPWVSPVVVVPKPSNPESIRLCTDMRAANKAIKRVKHPMPTIDELIHDLNGCKIFTKLDLEQGYHQIELHPSSRHITTFSTHLGLHRYKRLNFGVNAASEHFQHIIEVVLEGLKGVRNISDDIIIASENISDHEKHVRACLERLRQKGLTLNKSKCEFYKSSMVFFGNIFSENGVSPDPKKVNAILEASRPIDKRQVRSLLGMVNYVQRFIPGLANITLPLRELTKQNTDFMWSDDCEHAWTKLKSILTSSSVMSYFDPKLKTELVVDASPVGLGAILTQIDTKSSQPRIIAYASRALDAVQGRYSQIEREALAVRWGVEHFHLYLYGTPFTVVTDHKPLVSIFSNVISKPSPRIERWCLRLQQYTFTVVHRAGANNPADYMSRHPLNASPGHNRQITEHYVNYVVSSACPKAISQTEVIKATKDDPTLNNVIECITSISPKWYKFKQSEEMKIFEQVSKDLSVTSDGILLRGHRIVLPVSLRRHVVNLAHQGHQGVVKTKALLRAKIWFPYMDRLVEEIVSSCNSCASIVKNDTLQPLQMSELPSAPWQSVSADFSGPYPCGHYVLVVIDNYSRFPVAEIVSSTSSRIVIPVLDKIFSTHGNPEILKTDNGPPFQSYEFKLFMEQLGIRHRKITPLWPRANAQAENFMKPLNKAITAATVEGKAWSREMYTFLRNYRATPHITTGKAPAELLFGNNIRTCIPEVTCMKDDSIVRARDSEMKAKQKQYADERNHAKSSEICVGDTVLIRQKKRNKLTPAYNPEPFVVEKIKGSMITARSPNLGVKSRNSSMFKQISNSIPPGIYVQHDDHDETDVTPVPELVSQKDPSYSGRRDVTVADPFSGGRGDVTVAEPPLACGGSARDGAASDRAGVNDGRGRVNDCRGRVNDGRDGVNSGRDGVPVTGSDTRRDGSSSPGGSYSDPPAPHPTSGLVDRPAPNVKKRPCRQQRKPVKFKDYVSK